MDYFYLLLLCIPIPLIDTWLWRGRLFRQLTKGHRHISVQNRLRVEVSILETLVNVLLCWALASAVFAWQLHSKMVDTEILNGYVTSKEVVKKDCDYPGWHDYSDSFCTNEHTRSVIDHYEDRCDDKGKNCKKVAVYKTQYRYDYPWEKKYYVYTTLDDFKIERVDDQGATLPPRFDSVKQGDPASKTHTYKNRMLLADKNILNPQNVAADVTLLAQIPEYPLNVYDYYKLNRFVQIGTNIKQPEVWNQRISEICANIGPNKQANLVVVLTTLGRDVREAIYKKWNGGKKNDVILILGMKDGIVDWVEAITFLNNKGNEYMVADFANLIEQPAAPELLKAVEKTIMRKFDRTTMESVEFLETHYVPPTEVYLWALFWSQLLSIVIIIAKRNLEY